MNFLKTVFPISFKFTGSVSNLIIGIIIYVLVGIVGGVVIALASYLPFVGFLCWILGSLVDVYVVGGIVILFLSHFNVIK